MLETLFNLFAAPRSQEDWSEETPSHDVRDPAMAAPFETDLPVHDPALFVSRAWRLYEQVASNPFDEEVLAQVERTVDRRLDQAARILETYERSDPPAPAREIRDLLVAGFRLYWEGLARFRDFLFGGGYDLLEDALSLIFQGDEFVQALRRELTDGGGELRIVL